MLLDDSATACELRQARVDWAVLPIGALEQHGQHLPLGTDLRIAEELGRRLAQRLARKHDVFLVPTLPFSLSQCHGPALGTVWLLPRTFADAVASVVASLVDWGMRCIAIVNGHGGNFVLRDESAELNARFRGTVVIDASASPQPGPRETGRVIGGDIHAGSTETSLMLALEPDLVRSPGTDSVPPVGREFLDYAYLPEIVTSGVWGRPSSASREMGEEMIQAAAETMAKWVEEAYAQATMSEGPSWPS